MKKLKLSVAVAFLVLILVASILHYIMGSPIPTQKALYEGGQILGTAPFPPSSRFWFGTDQLGQDLFYRIIGGAKYTLFFAFVVSLGRIILGLFLGFGLTYFKRSRRIFVAVSEPLNFIPVTLICLFLLLPVTVSTHFSSSEKIVIQLAFMILAAVPLLAILVNEEIDHFLKQEFVQASQVLGGTFTHIIRTHLFSQMKGRIILLWLQQVVHSLILLAHLGLFKIFIGGVKFEHIYDGQETAISGTSEWSGLIGSYFYQLQLSPWLLLFPVLFFTLSVLSVNVIAEYLISKPEPKALINELTDKESQWQAETSISSFSLLSTKEEYNNE